MRHLVSLKEQSKEEIANIIELGSKLKSDYMSGKVIQPLLSRTLIMLFEKASTRTRLSFEAGMTELGGHAVFLDARTTQISIADFKDEVRAIMRMGHFLMFRALKAADVEMAASFNLIPVIDGCSEKYHPCQALGDILTMSESAGGLANIKKVVWLGIENNVSNTLVLACAKLGIDIFLVTPEKDIASVDEELMSKAEKTGRVHRTLDLKEAIRGADFIHTDTWMNMEFFDRGKVKPEFEDEYRRRLNVFEPYQLNAKLLAANNSNAKIMHCMPCHAGYEISRDAIDHKNSLIFDQAENRKHIQKSVLLWLSNQEDHA